MIAGTVALGERHDDGPNGPGSAFPSLRESIPTLDAHSNVIRSSMVSLHALMKSSSASGVVVDEVMQCGDALRADGVASAVSNHVAVVERVLAHGIGRMGLSVKIPGTTCPRCDQRSMREHGDGGSSRLHAKHLQVREREDHGSSARRSCRAVMSPRSPSKWRDSGSRATWLDQRACSGATCLM